MIFRSDDFFLGVIGGLVIACLILLFDLLWRGGGKDKEASTPAPVWANRADRLAAFRQDDIPITWDRFLDVCERLSFDSTYTYKRFTPWHGRKGFLTRDEFPALGDWFCSHAPDKPMMIKRTDQTYSPTPEGIAYWKSLTHARMRTHAPEEAVGGLKEQ